MLTFFRRLARIFDQPARRPLARMEIITNGQSSRLW